MSRTGMALAIVFALWSAPIRCEEETEPEPVGTSVREEPDLNVFEAILPGDLVDWGVLPTDSSPRPLALLIEMEDDSRQVLRWSLDGVGGLEDLGPRLPKEVDSLITYRGAPTTGEGILVAEKGTLSGLGADGRWQELHRSPFDLFAIWDTRGGRLSPAGDLIVRSVGLLQALRWDAAGAELQARWQFEMPLRVDREWGGLRIDTPAVTSIDQAAEGALRLILGPEMHGQRRIRSVLLDLSSAGELETLETWNMLSTPEEIEESWYVQFNGQTALIVTTVLAEKHGVFEKKKLRLFQLSGDRTRSGSGPILEVMTHSRNWYGTCAGIADVNGDGWDDLVSAQPKGLGAGSLWVEAHLADPGGGFNPKPRGSEVQVEEGEPCTLGTDIEGDGQVELVVVEGDALLVFPIRQQAESKTVVDDQARWQVAFETIEGRPRPVDLFSSASSQFLVMGHTEGKRQAVRVVQFH